MDELREHIHRIFTAGPDTYTLVSRERADNMRREIYRERARLKREAPDSQICRTAESLTFRLEGPMLIVASKQVRQLVRDLARAAGGLQ